MSTQLLRDILVGRDGISYEEADKQIAEAREQLMQYLDDGDTEAAEYICEEFFGLEPDYIDQLL